MVRTLIKGVIAIALIAIIALVINKVTFTTAKTNSNKSNITSTSKILPLFEFYTLDDVPFSKYNVEKNTSLIIVYFDPDCSLCEKSGEVFGKFNKLHKSSQVIFVSHNTNQKIRAYQKRFNLDTLANVKFLKCKKDDFYTLFKTYSTPSYFIYNTKQQLVKIIDDDVPVKTILRYIKAAQVD